MVRRSHQPFKEATFVGLLILYLLAGIRVVPFHGDESTIIHKSRDWYLLAQGDLSSLFYSANPVDSAEQELRLVNGVVSEYSIGLLASLSGLGLRDLPQQWLWGADWDYNLANGHIPSDQLLFIGRLASALLTALSIALVFAIARRVGGPSSAYVAALLYTSMPAVLLNGRRAMFEGATLLAVPLVIMAGLVVASRLGKADAPKQWRLWILFGLAVGFGMASKHSLIVTIVPVFAALIFVGLRNLARTLACGFASAVIAVVLFIVLNPTWWSAPLRVPGEVVRLRAKLATEQIAYYGGYSYAPDRLTALWTQVVAAPQYYENDKGWPDWIGGQIAIYEASGLQGLTWSPVSATALFILSIVGSVFAWKSAGPSRRATLLIFAWILGFSLFGIFMLTPLAWQRYYLPLAAPLAVGYGLGLTALMSALWQRLQAAPKVR